MNSLFFIWLLFAAVVYLAMAVGKLGPLQKGRRMPGYPGRYRPFDPLADQGLPERGVDPAALLDVDDVDEGVSLEMSQEQTAPTPIVTNMNSEVLDQQPEDLIKAIIWSEILQPPLSVRRPRH